LFISAVYSYASPEDFWLKYSAPSTDEDTDSGERKRFKMTKIIAMLRLLKRHIDTNNAELASQEFCHPVEFMKHFSYRK